LACGETGDASNDSKLVVFDRCGHVPQIEKAKDFNNAVLKFLFEK
jgi:pimeloyl-ACP methyl ester carboxylesterase